MSQEQSKTKASVAVRSFDAIIVGAGQAGPPLVSHFVKAGKTVAIIERKLLGGTCVNVGCTPTKAMVASAEAVQRARSSEEFGFSCSNIAVDLAKVKARKDAIVEASRSGLEKMLTGTDGCTLFRGAASFESPTTMRVDGELLTAPAIFLNVGARPEIPAVEGIDSIPFLTSSTILELTTVPKHLVILGGSFIGLEFAQMFRRFGAEVTVLERSGRLLSHDDEDVSATVKEILESEGVKFCLEAEEIQVRPCSAGVCVSTVCQVGSKQIEGSHLLVALGRKPNTDDLGAEKAGLRLDKKGYVNVDDTLHTNVPGIWAMGDCNGKGAFTHTAYNDYEIVAANLFHNDPRKVSDRIQAHALYIDPPYAQIGMTEAEVRATGKPAMVGVTPMSKVGRAREKGETRGAIKIFVDQESQRILGASIFGPGGDEAIHCLLTAMYSGQPASLVSRSVHIHPTVAELIPTTLQALKPLK